MNRKGYSTINNYVKRTIRLIFGLFLYALGSFLSIQANIGLAPWEAFSMGGSYLTHISYGNIVVISGFVIIAIDFAFKEKIGFGTILNAILIGKFVDLIQFANIVPLMSNFWLGILMLLLGQVVICVGSYFYIGASLGCGPRDALMVALGKRMPKVPIGAIRGLIEGTVLIIGWLLGAKVGMGTVISVFGIGLILQFTFNLLRFDVKNIKHESVADTVKAM
ncbi:YitT family protein [Desulfitobacterium sp. Sab5]|uniref:YczE/YyaS/YitT family protein n=1 Tax=Desulfitobacterium nosdiversum TaxID=3375356 RepID=UPI003CEC20B2